MKPAAFLRASPLVLALVAAGAAAQKKQAALYLLPRVAPGQVLRYDVTYHRLSQVTTTSMVQNPASTVTTDIVISLAVRVQIAEVTPPAFVADATPRPSAIHVYAAYLRAQAAQRSDDPVVDDRAAEKAIARLEGKSFDCRIGSDGAAACSPGSDSDAVAAEGMRRWLAEIFFAARLPQKGISPGQTWETEEDAGAELPLAGLRLVRKYLFAGEKPCREPAAAGPGATAPAEACAEIRVNSRLVQKGSKKDATPEAFRLRGLRTSGSARGGNESVLLISLAAGLAVSSGGSDRQSADYTISSSKAHTAIHTVAEVKTDSDLRQAPDAP
ncbi:MAG TPA: hypothetical protein VEH49_00790 [Methylomirabilota bacterium]|nr:hypothetical protein [Methylomirabilota bacterium]